jgi:teichuronic acid biosynthesis glycosyltransferase TuaC
MRLGVLSTSYPTRDDEAAGSFVKAMADALAARGHTVTSLFPEHAERDHPRGENPRLVPLAYARPRVLERTFYGAGVPDNVARNPLLALLGLSFSARLHAASRELSTGWDAVVAHFLLPTGVAAASLGKPCLVVAHSADLHLLERLPQRSTIARYIDDRSRLWFVSHEAHARFERLLGRAARVAPIVTPMGATHLDPSPREASRERLGLPRDALVVGSLSRLVHVKGLDVAVDALARLGGGELVVGGEGPLAPSLLRRARARSVRLRLLGALDESGKRDLFGAADVFVAPSRTLRSGRSEGVPVAMLEALAAGLPVVASRVGGIAAHFAHEPRVRLVTEEDSAELAEAIQATARLPRRAVHTRTWDDLASEIEASLTDERRRSSAAASTGTCDPRRRDRTAAS